MGVYMTALICDACGAKLVMGAGGKTASCEFCGLQYSLERLREKVQEIKGSVSIEGSVQARQTGTSEDVAQWHMLLNKYIAAFDYERAKQIVTKILEAAPSDAEANQAYGQLQTLQYFEIKNGTMAKYHGRDELISIPAGIEKIGVSAFQAMCFIKKVIVPEGVTCIDAQAFKSCSIQEIVLPESLLDIRADAFECSSLQVVNLPKNLRNIGASAFYSSGLKVVDIPGSVETIGSSAFNYCDLKELTIQNGVKNIGSFAFASSKSLTELVLPMSVIHVGEGAFAHCDNLERIVIKNDATQFKNDRTYISDSAWFSGDKHITSVVWGHRNWRDIQTIIKGSSSPYETKLWWAENKRCTYCGGDLSIFNSCKKCGRKNPPWLS